MYFTLAVSAPDAAACADLIQRGCGTDPRALPIAGPARVAWRAPDGRSALLTWGPGATAAHSAAGTIRVSDEQGGTMHASPAPTNAAVLALHRSMVKLEMERNGYCSTTGSVVF